MSIEREFIPYEQALALKELGFDEECFGCYNSKHNLWFENPVNSKYDIPEDNILAPLYQQAFKWFREKYSVDAKIEKDMVDVYYGEKRNNELPFEYEPITIGFDTYEVAELECLKKLIEIVKEK